MDPCIKCTARLNWLRLLIKDHYYYSIHINDNMFAVLIARYLINTVTADF